MQSIQLTNVTAHSWTSSSSSNIFFETIIYPSSTFRSNRKPNKFIIIMSAALLRLNGRRHETSGATRWWFQCLWILSAGNIFNSIQYVTSAHLSSTSDTLNKLQRYQQDVQQQNRESHEVGLRCGSFCFVDHAVLAPSVMRSIHDSFV